MSKKIIVIGLDGGTWDYILPYIEELPTFKYLIENGSWGNLESVIQPHTAPAWPSFMTGKYPSKHGIYSFFYKTDEHEINFINSRDIHGPTVMDILNYFNKKVTSINIPVTYPVWEINSIMISGMLTQNADKSCYPPNLMEELHDYKIEADTNFDENNIPQFLNTLYDTMDKRKKAVFYLMDKYPWDYLSVVFRLTDTIAHTMYQYLDPSHPLHKKYGNAILETYKKVDTLLKEFLEKIDDQTTLMLMSDHGHGKFVKGINLNLWLLKEGYLYLKSDFLHRLKYLIFKLGFSQTGIYKIISKFKLQNFITKVSRQKRYKATNLLLSYKDVDWNRTKAYSLGPFGQIYINLKNRNKDGIVEPGAEYNKLIQELKNKLFELKDPDNNTQIFEKILHKEEVYQGPLLDKAPDLYLISKNFEYACSELFATNNSLFSPAPKGWTGTHKLHGIFLAYGKEIKQNNKIESARIVDIAPTTLHLFDLPVIDDMDGKVLQSIFIKKKKVNIINHKNIISKKDKNKEFKENKEKLTKRLESLGYI